MTNIEKLTLDTAKGCWYNNDPQEGVEHVVKNLLAVLAETDVDMPDWNRVIKLRMTIASAVGCLQGVSFDA